MHARRAFCPTLPHHVTPCCASAYQVNTLYDYQVFTVWHNITLRCILHGRERNHLHLLLPSQPKARFDGNLVFALSYRPQQSPLADLPAGTPPAGTPPAGTPPALPSALVRGE